MYVHNVHVTGHKLITNCMLQWLVTDSSLLVFSLNLEVYKLVCQSVVDNLKCVCLSVTASSTTFTALSTARSAYPSLVYVYICKLLYTSTCLLEVLHGCVKSTFLQMYVHCIHTYIVC